MAYSWRRGYRVLGSMAAMYQTVRQKLMEISCGLSYRWRRNYLISDCTAAMYHIVRQQAHRWGWRYHVPESTATIGVGVTCWIPDNLSRKIRKPWAEYNRIYTTYLLFEISDGMRGGPPAWDLGEVLTTPPSENQLSVTLAGDMIPLDTKQFGGKQLHRSDLRGECF